MSIGHSRQTREERTVTAICYAIVSVFAFLCLYPFWNVFINSIATGEEASRGVYLFPTQMYWGVYDQIIKQGAVVRAMGVSASRTIISTILCVTCSSMFAYLVTQQQMLFRKFVYRFAIITMYVGAGLIPWYLTMKSYGLYNNFYVYVIPGMISVYYCILIKTYIESLPSSLEEAARIDGAGFFTTFFAVILPLCKPILATVALYQAVGQWNSYMDNYLLVQNTSLQTIQMVLFNYVRESESIAKSMQQAALSGGSADAMTTMAGSIAENMTPDAVRNATTLVSMLPIMLVYPFLQKYFAKGIMMGAVKG